MKSLLYATPRKRSRPQKDISATALSHFISTGGMAGPADLACEIINYALDQRWTISILQDGPSVCVKRVL